MPLLPSLLLQPQQARGFRKSAERRVFYIADGGMQFTLKKNTYPDYDTAASSIPLGDGSGSFTVTVPTLTSDAASGDTSLSVSSTTVLL